MKGNLLAFQALAVRVGLLEASLHTAKRNSFTQLPREYVPIALTRIDIFAQWFFAQRIWQGNVIRVDKKLATTRHVRAKLSLTPPTSRNDISVLTWHR